ncbi:MAG: DUF1552 domain-containing protein, partial [Clostridia bacterium]|nr:DUF1552 domain-containing protein [Deltaproteobacteria bacterium]
MKYLDRRTVLRGVVSGVGATVGLPILDAMLNLGGTKLANGATVPLRYGTWFWGNGAIIDAGGFRPWVPAATGSAWQPKEELQSLVGQRDMLSIVSGREAYHDGEWLAHHTGRFVMLSGSYARDAEYGNSLGPSIDRVIADAWQGTAPLDSVDVGVSKRGFGTSAYNDSTSFFGFDRDRRQMQWNLPVYSPDAVYDRIFRIIGPSGGQTDPAVTAQLRSRRSVLDVVMEDANALRASL